MTTPLEAAALVVRPTTPRPRAPITARETCVSVADEAARHRWRAIFGVGDHALGEAVRSAGNDVFAVSRWLSQHTGSAGGRQARRGPRPGNRRDALLQAAMREVRHCGVRGMSFQRVALHADCSRSALVMYFLSKEGLGLAIIEGAERDFFDHVVLPTIAVDTGMARVRSLAGAWVADTVAHQGSLLAALVFELQGVPGSLRQRLSLFLQRVQRVFEALVADAHVKGEARVGLTGASLLFQIEAVVLALGVATRQGDGAKARAQAQQALTWLWRDASLDVDVDVDAPPAVSAPLDASLHVPSSAPSSAPIEPDVRRRHRDRVDLWLFGLRPDVDSVLYVQLFQHAMNMLHSQVLVMLGEATLHAVGERALSEVTGRFPLLAGVRVLDDGAFDCSALRGVAADGNVVRRASRALFIEVLTMLSRLTGDVLLDTLHEAVTLAEADAPSA